MDKERIAKHILRMVDADEIEFESMYGIPLRDMVDFIIDNDERQRIMTEIFRNNTLDNLIG